MRVVRLSLLVTWNPLLSLWDWPRFPLEEAACARLGAWPCWRCLRLWSRLSRLSRWRVSGWWLLRFGLRVPRRARGERDRLLSLDGFLPLETVVKPFVSSTNADDSSASVKKKKKKLLWWPQCWFHKIEVSAMYSYIPLGLNQLLNVRVDQWFHICIVDTCQWVYLLVEGLFGLEIFYWFLVIIETEYSRLFGQYHTHWWPGSLSGQGISRHCIDRIG